MKIVKRVLLAVLLAVLIVFPMSYDNAYVHILLSQTLVNIVIVMGLNFITGLTGQMNLGTAGIMALGAYIAALTSTRLGTSPWIGFLLAIVMGVAIGWVLGTVVAVLFYAFTKCLRKSYIEKYDAELNPPEDAESTCAAV